MSPFGDEYPAAVTFKGVRMPLVSESRWTRGYASDDPKMGYNVSRFMDGSAAITLQEFALEWPSWNERERSDFCSACSWLNRQDDYPDILRHIMRYGGPKDWSAVASSVGGHLPQSEAFDLLSRALLQVVGLDQATNIIQGISLTKHPEAEAVLRSHLLALWSHPSLWADAPFVNWHAYGATCCIKNLIEIGAPPADFTEQARALAAHPCVRNRNSCRRFLAKHFPWLNDSTDAPGNA